MTSVLVAAASTLGTVVLVVFGVAAVVVGLGVFLLGD